MVSFKDVGGALSAEEEVAILKLTPYGLSIK